MKALLLIAGIYNIVWGAVLFIFHFEPFDLGAMGLSARPMIWQIVGVMVVVFGIGYLVASMNPFRHWPVVMIGVIFKSLASIVLGYLIIQGQLSTGALLVIFSNSLIWIAPFTVVLFGAFEQNRKFSEQLNYFYSSRADVNKLPILTNKGASLMLLSESSPVMLVFLRHFGCSFCREAMNALSRDRRTIEALGTKIVLVHMVSENRAKVVTGRYGLADLHRISDPEKKLYESFALERGNFRQLLGLKVLIRSVFTALFGRNFPGLAEGDPTQLPGVFLLYKGEVVKAYRHDTAADTPDYIFLANCETCL